MEKKNYVLIHGAWHGGWCWRSVAGRLRGLGHQVYTPTLSGCGERSHLMNAETDLELNIADIAAVIRFEDLSDVILCGHSYGGMVITAVADRVPHAVRALVYVDGYVPAHGESVIDIRPAEDNETLMEQVALHGHGWRMPPRSASDMKVQQPSDRDWVDSHLTDTALRCFTQRVSLSRPVEEGDFRRCYVRAGNYPNERFQAHFEHAVSSPVWDSFVVDGAGHDIMVDQPERLSDILAATG